MAKIYDFISMIVRDYANYMRSGQNEIDIEIRRREVVPPDQGGVGLEGAIVIISQDQASIPAILISAIRVWDLYESYENRKIGEQIDRPTGYLV